MRRGGSRNGKSWLDRRRWRGKARKAKPKQALGLSRSTRGSARAPARGRGRGGVPGPRIRKEYWVICCHCGRAFKAKKRSRLGQYCRTRCRVATWRERRRANQGRHI